MHKLNLQTFVLSTNDKGEKICTLQADPTKRYVLDDEGNLTKYTDAQETSDDIIALDSENSSNDSSTGNFSPLHDQSLDIIHLDNHHDFEENLMNELDTGLMKMVESGNNQVIQHMDIREPLSKLRKLLERKLKTNLSDFRFTLQNSQFLDEDKNLVNQCVQGEGLVQINAQIEILSRKINILDVLKPAEDYIHGEDIIEIDDDSSHNQTEDSLQEPMETEDVQNLMQWQVDLQYKREQERLKIPFDPNDWTTLHVRHWIQWAVRQFNLSNIKLSDWNITGKDLFQLTMEGFQKIVPNDPGDLFWTHLELLRKMRLVATLRETGKKSCDAEEIKHENKKTKNKIEDKTVYSEVAYLYHSAGNKTGNNGQIQLWQFLLELLTNKDYTSVIQWTGKDAEFKLTHPEVVAHLWGERKNKPTMNYEKLSRALRYYYDGDLISKVHGKRFVYKFVIDLKELLGYSANELANLVKHGNPTTLHWKVN